MRLAIYLWSAIDEDSKWTNYILEEQSILNAIRENLTIRQEELAKIIGKSIILDIIHNDISDC